jgi:hypothetical protein
MSRRIAWGLAALCAALGCAGAAGAQVVHTYTQSETGSQRIALGYPVPRPVASLTPVDGFRDFASLDARLRLLDADSADLAGHDVGQTTAGRTLRAYVVSDADAVDGEGRAEAAFFINGGIHAREWGTPEVTTYLVERMVEGADDQGLVRYLLDTTRLVIVPVHNVDGFQQTQRYPERVIVGQDPRAPASWPRDGRMRRKNMRGVDEELESFGDHLGGIDLNRNHPPFWGTTTLGETLTDPNELVYRGSAAHSEPESQALVQAAELAPPSRLRLGIDVHSYGRVFFSSNTGRTRLNQIQARLLALLINHHVSVPTAEGDANNALYRDEPDPPNSGIGAAAEYFAYQWLVPAMTLELEPRNSGADYGGTGVSHSGFILPESQVRRVREAWAESFLVGFYFMAGPPHLREVRIRDAASGALLQSQHWLRDAVSGRRDLVSEQFGQAFAGQPLLVELVFSKPMRHRDASGNVASLPGLSMGAAPVVRRLLDAGGSEMLDTLQGSWLGRDGFDRYRDDTFRFGWTPMVSGPVQLEVVTSDMVGLSLDADPATPVDWQDGAWSEWEDASGTDGDVGGADRLTASLSVAEAGNPDAVALSSVPNVVGEGDRLRVRLTRSAEDAAGALQLSGRVGGSAEAVVTWTDGESGARELALPVQENVALDGTREANWEVHVVGATDGPPLFTGSVRVYDNDRPGQAVWHEASDPRSALQQLAESPAAQRELVLDGGRSYVGPSNPLAICQQFDMQAPLRVHGNRATLQPGESSCSLVALQGQGVVELRDLELDGRVASDVHRPLVQGGETDVSLQRVIMRNAGGFAISTEGDIRIGQSALLDARLERGGRDGRRIGAVETTGGIEWINSSDYGALLIGEDGRTLGQESALITSLGQGESTVIGMSWNYGAPFWLAGQGTYGNSVDFVMEGDGVAIGTLGVCRGNYRSTGFNLLNVGVICGESQLSDRSFGLLAPSLTGPDLAWRLPPDELVDSGGDCGAVDQRGAPRPQTLDPEAEPRCDVGAVEQGVNPWRGFWQPERNGHGIDLQTSGNVLTLLWYTYSEDGQPTAYLAAAPLTGPRWQAELLTAARDPDSGAISNPVVGTVSLEFDSDVEATLGWQFNGRVAGSERVTALDFAGSEPRVEVTGSWFPPAESGNGASIARRGEVTAMALYYYDAAGVLRWALGQGSGDDVIRVPLESFTGFCPDCDAAANPLASMPAGEAILHFRTPQRLVVDSDLSYPGSNGGRWTRAAADFVPLNDPVDNREAAAASR